MQGKRLRASGTSGACGSEGRDALARLADEVRERPTALLCVEREDASLAFALSLAASRRNFTMMMVRRRWTS